MSVILKFKYLLLCATLLASPLAFGQSDTPDCGFSGDPNGGEAGLLAPAPSKGVAKGVAIYATWSPYPDTLPERWARIWDSTVQLSVPKYYKDNSLGQYHLQIIPNGRDAGHCFESDTQPSGYAGGFAFTKDILQKVDDVINFANFDSDSDNIVDAVCLVIVNLDFSPGPSSLLAVPDTGFLTNDYSATGRMRIMYNRGTGNIVRPTFGRSAELSGLAVCCHEWGHVLGSPDKLWLGNFSLMTPQPGLFFGDGRPVPVDPEERLRYGWITLTSITAPLFGQTIPDFLTTGIVYELTAPTIPGNIVSGPQRFWVTNYKGVNPITVPEAAWELNIPRSGLLIWHRQTGASATSSDLELPHGMYQYNLDSCIRLQSDSVSGLDSLDLSSHPPCGWAYPQTRGSGSCIWPYFPSGLPAKTNFDGKSNPSSDVWFRTSLYNPAYQIGTSHVAVRNIKGVSLVPDTADLLVNNWYGHIAANTTWGPGGYAITGDITVDSGKTLTIQPGTTIYFQKNEDNQASGVNTGKSELTVANGGNLVAISTPGSPIKFLSSSSNPYGSEWYGIRVFGSAKLTNCWLKNAYAGIDFQNTAYDTIRACVFENNYYFGLQARNNNVYIVQDTFKNNGMGVCFDPASAVVESCYFKDNWIGIYTLRSFGRITHNKIIGTCYNSDVGFQAEGYVAGATQFLTFENNLDSGQFNIAAVIANARVKIKDSRVRIVKQTCFPVPAEPPLNIDILGLGTDTASIRHTFIKSTGYTSNAPPTVEIDAAPTLDIGQAGADSGNNSITRGTGGKAVLNYSGSSVYARQNYWATSTPDSATLFGGAVLFTPYLTTEPSPPSAPRIAVEEETEGTLPKQYTLGQNYPNPFNPATTIQFSLPAAGKVRLKVFNLLGQEVLTLLDAEKPAGAHQIVWDGRDVNGIAVASGIYFYKLESASFKEVKRMIFLK